MYVTNKLTYVMLAVLILALGSYGCGTKTQSKDNEDKDSTETIPVEAASVEIGDIAAYYSTTATLEAENVADIVPKVQGEVEQIHVEEGDFVEKGEKLAVLDHEQLKIELDRTQAEMNRLKNEYKRKEKLYNKELISAEEFDNARYAYETQKAAHELARLKLRHSTIKAPFSGVISRRDIKVGNMISTNEPAFEVTDFDPLLAIIHIPEHEMSKLKTGQKAELRVDALPDTSFNAYVKRISPVVDPGTGTFKVTMAVSDPTRQLKPGMFGRINIIYDTHPNTLMIPKQAVMEEDGNSNVFMIDDKMAFRRKINTGYINGDYIEIVSGLEEDQQVVTVGQSSLQDSALVEVIEF